LGTLHRGKNSLPVTRACKKEYDYMQRDLSQSVKEIYVDFSNRKSMELNQLLAQNMRSDLSIKTI